MKEQKNLTLGDVIALLNKEQGFYIRDSRICENEGTEADIYYVDSDDFYESSTAKYDMEKQLLFISTLNDKLLIIIGKN